MELSSIIVIHCVRFAVGGTVKAMGKKAFSISNLHDRL